MGQRQTASPCHPMSTEIFLPVNGTHCLGFAFSEKAEKMSKNPDFFKKMAKQSFLPRGKMGCRFSNQNCWVIFKQGSIAGLTSEQVMGLKQEYAKNTLRREDLVSTISDRHRPCDAALDSGPKTIYCLISYSDINKEPSMPTDRCQCRIVHEQQVEKARKAALPTGRRSTNSPNSSRPLPTRPGSRFSGLCTRRRCASAIWPPFSG